MEEWTVQFSLLAQGNDFGDWANILFIVIIMVFSVIGGLIKNAEAKRKKQQTGRGIGPGPAKGPPGRETWQQRLIRKAEEVQRAVEAKYGEAQPTRRAPSTAGTRPPEQGKLSVRTGRGGESVMVFEKEQPESAARRQAIRERQVREAEAAVRRNRAKRRLGARYQRESITAKSSLHPQEAAPFSTPAEISREPVGSIAAPSIIDYDDPDALKKAVLHYEILGKPLALRDSFERTSGY